LRSFYGPHPPNEGHVLVVPRQAAGRLTQLEPALAEHLFRIAQTILTAIEKSDIPCDGANLFLSDGEIAGQDVPHVHLHIVPRFAQDQLKVSFGRAPLQPTRSDLDQTAQKIVQRMRRPTE